MIAQEFRPIVPLDDFLNVATDARAAGQGDIGVATRPDNFSLLWNASKYLFHEKRLGVGVTQLLPGSTTNSLDNFSQANVLFFNRGNDRSVYGLGFRAYDLQGSNEVSIDGSYGLRLSETFGMSVGGRFISLSGKLSQVDAIGNSSATNLFVVNVNGYYHGDEIAYKKFNGRWRGGFAIANLRGRQDEDSRKVGAYAPTNIKVGVGFDFIFNQNNLLGVTGEYKTLLNSYLVTTNVDDLNYEVMGTTLAMGVEYSYKNQFFARAGYSYGIQSATDRFASAGTGLGSRLITIEVAILIGLPEEANLIQNGLRLSLNLDFNEIF